MQKLFIILISMLISIPSFAQKIDIDEDDANGKIITTEFLPVIITGEKKCLGYVSLGVAYNSAMQTLFCINLKFENEPNLRISKGNAIQLVTKEGEIIVLHNTSNIITLDDKKTVIIPYGVQYNEIEVASLDKIMNERIVKLKIETDNGIVEKEIHDNMFSKSIYSSFIILKNYLESQKDE